MLIFNKINSSVNKIVNAVNTLLVITEENSKAMTKIASDNAKNIEEIKKENTRFLNSLDARLPQLSS